MVSLKRIGPVSFWLPITPKKGTRTQQNAMEPVSARETTGNDLHVCQKPQGNYTNLNGRKGKETMDGISDLAMISNA